MKCKSCHRRIAKDSFSCPYCGSYQLDTDAVGTDALDPAKAVDPASTADPAKATGYTKAADPTGAADYAKAATSTPMVEPARTIRKVAIVPIFVVCAIVVLQLVFFIWIFRTAFTGFMKNSSIDIPTDLIEASSADRPPLDPSDLFDSFNLLDDYRVPNPGNNNNVGTDFRLPEGPLMIPSIYKTVLIDDNYAIGVAVLYVGSPNQVNIMFYAANRPDAYVTVSLTDCSVNGQPCDDPESILGKNNISPNSSGAFYIQLIPQTDIDDLSELRITVNITDRDTAEVYLTQSFGVDCSGSGLDRDYTITP